MVLNILDHTTQFLAVCVLLGSANLLTEDSLNTPTISLGEGGKFIHLAVVLLNAGTHSGEYANSIHN
jgi:hypothetical protein